MTTRHHHPRKNDKGQPVVIHAPTLATGPVTWSDASAIAVFVPDGPVPATLNGTDLGQVDPPENPDDWERLVMPTAASHAAPLKTGSKKASAGVVILEPDGRVWLIEPTNHFGGYERTFPKGTQEAGFSLAASAARETYEEAGLLVEVGRYLIDVDRSLSVARYFIARRIGGTPAAMGWESQAVWLVPRDRLKSMATAPVDGPIIDAIVALDIAREIEALKVARNDRT